MGYTLVSSATAGSPDQNNVTTAPINTTSANLIIISVTRYLAGSLVTLSDSKSNTWTPLTSQSSSADENVLYYAYSPTVGAGHTFTLSSSGAFPTIGVVAFSGSPSSPFESENGSIINVSTFTVQPGSVTPLESGCVIATGVSFFVATGLAIDSGFSKAATDYAGNNLAGGIGWIIQGVAAPVNPTWSSAIAINNAASTIAVFKAAAPPPSGTRGSLAMMGVGT